MKALENKVALVTGATSGIGRAAAIALAEAGAMLVVTGRREAEGAETVDLAAQAGAAAVFVQGDISDEDHVRTAVATAIERFGRLDIAFNNAGVELVQPILDATYDDYRRVVDINVWGVLSSMKHEIPAMLAGGGGSIINTSSVAGHVGMAGAAIYVASKHAVEGLTKTAALEFAREGIRVNAVAPAAIETAMIDRFAGAEGSEQRAGLASMHPIGRMGKPMEIAAAVRFLASDASSFVTGHSLALDGGWLAQ